MKTPEEMAEEYADDRCGNWQECERDNEWEEAKRGFLAGFKAGREMSNKEIFDYYLELRKKHGQEESEQKPVVEKFSLTLIEKKGFF